jgi:hypothetical protein
MRGARPRGRTFVDREAERRRDPAPVVLVGGMQVAGAEIDGMPAECDSPGTSADAPARLEHCRREP